MIAELWGSFPRLLEQNINGLLDTAEPNPTKAFQLYKSCKNEDLWRENFETFSAALREFYASPRGTRRKSQFDKHLDRPMDSVMFGAFHLDFRTAVVDDRAVDNLASWASNLIRVSKKSVSAFASFETIGRALRVLVSPGPLDKAENFEFDDFCGAWKKTVTREHGALHERELTALVGELQRINAEHAEIEVLENATMPLLVLTETDIDWIRMVRLAALAHSKLPRAPASRGPRKQVLRDLDRVVQLYEIVLETKLPELLKHRESTRVTLLDRCESLLMDATGSTGTATLRGAA